ncbi:MAG: hypothetical protein ACOH2A_00595 [Sphingobacteriaceae bacterium]
MLLHFYQKKWFKITAITISAILLLLIAAGISVNSYWSPILGEKIKKNIYTATDSLYIVDFSKIRLHVLQGNIIIDNITLTPDTAVYSRRKRAKKATNNLYQLKVEQIVFKHVHPLQLYFNKKLNIQAINIINPDLQIKYENLVHEDSTVKDQRTVYQRIKADLHAIAVAKINLTDVNFRYTDLSGEKPKIISLKNLDIGGAELLIDSVTQTDKKRFLFCKDISARMNNYHDAILDGLYTYQFKSLMISTKLNAMELIGLTVKPHLSETKFAEKFKVQTERYELSFDSIRMENFDLKALNKYRKLRSSNLHLTNGKLAIYADRRFPKPAIDKVQNYPHNALKRLKMDIKIDTVNLKNVGISYTEFNPKSGEKGKITFTKINGTISNVTTNQAALNKDHMADAHLTAYLMGHGKLDLQIKFNLTDPKASFNYKGSLGPMVMKQLNPVTIPLGMIKINNGYIKKLIFDVNGDASGAQGNLTFLYNDLKISILKKNKKDDNIQKQGFISMIANALIITDANPMVNEPAREVKVAFLRPKQASFFNVMWKTLFVGVKETVGLTAGVEREMKEKVSAHVRQKTERENKREIRRKNRAVRREERAKD